MKEVVSFVDKLQRPLLSVMIVGALIAVVLLRRPPEEIVPLVSLATLVVQFFFRKAGPG